ncbi:MAG: RagB/SusD family nutrient uptake outer membrane protein, partial [Bacteroidota bacterium]
TLSPLMNEIRRERRVEFAFEAFRHSDLMRWRAHHLFVGKRPLGGKFIDYYNGASQVSVNADGNVDFWMAQIPNGYEFDPDRDYLYPIPQDQITLTGGAITQNPGWE